MPAAVGRIAICVVAATLLAGSTQDLPAAGRGGKVPPSRPGWLPYSNSRITGLTPAQGSAARRVVAQIEQILLQVPELASPKGFEIGPQVWGGGRLMGPGETTDPASVVEYGLSLYFFNPTKAIAGHGCSCIIVRVNFKDVASLTEGGGGFYTDEQGRAIYTEPRRDDLLPFTTQVYGRLTREQHAVTAVLTSGREPFWKAVTREQFYKAVVLDTTGKDGVKLRETQKSLEKTPYQRWLEGAAQRRNGREEAIRIASAVQPAAEVAKLRKTLEDAERETTENLKAADAGERIENKANLDLFERRLQAIRAELESMTAAERNMPALIDPARTDGFNATGSTMADVDSPSVLRVLMPDYDFWRARKSPAEVRSIAVSIVASGTGLTAPVHHALLQTYQKLDWAALNRLLDVPNSAAGPGPGVRILREIPDQLDHRAPDTGQRINEHQL